MSEAILDEIGGVSARKFDWQSDDIAEARRWIPEIARMATPAVQLNVIQEDPADDRILECAVAAGADYIISGDNDLLRLGQYDGMPVMNPSDFLTLFQSLETSGSLTEDVRRET